MPGKHRKKSDKSNKSKILLIIEVILIIIALFSLYKIVRWWIENKQSAELLSDISEYVDVNKDEKIVIDVDNQNVELDEYSVDFAKLKEMNEDVIAWIKVPGTKIEYPVVKAENNDYYLTRSLDKSYNSAGWVFADYRAKGDGTDQNLVIYGHNRRDGTMFGTLKNILDSEWYNNEENKYITFKTENGTDIYEVISVYQVEAEDYYTTPSFSTEREFDEFISKLSRRSVKDFKVPVQKDDQILTLSTCANNNKYRVVLHAKKIKQNTQVQENN